MHYKNGRAAKVGDPVVGTVYNTPGIIAGILLGITPGTDTCNCRVGMIKSTPVEESPGDCGMLHVELNPDGTQKRLFNILQVDYSACSNLLHAEDAFGAFAQPQPVEKVP